MDKVLLKVDPKELWKFALDEDGYRTEVEILEPEEKYLNGTQKKQREIYNHYGFDIQLDKLEEECLELALAIKNRCKPHSKGFKNVIEEIADVLNVLEQILDNNQKLKNGGRQVERI